MEKETMELKKYKRYEAYVARQKDAVTNLLNALSNFEQYVDFPMYCAIEENFMAMQHTLKEMQEKPEEYCREFDEKEDW